MVTAQTYWPAKGNQNPIYLLKKCICKGGILIDETVIDPKGGIWHWLRVKCPSTVINIILQVRDWLC
jgi:hypothetical protein